VLLTSRALAAAQRRCRSVVAPAIIGDFRVAQRRSRSVVAHAIIGNFRVAQHRVAGRHSLERAVRRSRKRQLGEIPTCVSMHADAVICATLDGTTSRADDAAASRARRCMRIP
jgi:hypothetical protein